MMNSNLSFRVHHIINIDEMDIYIKTGFASLGLGLVFAKKAKDHNDNKDQ